MALQSSCNAYTVWRTTYADAAVLPLKGNANPSAKGNLAPSRKKYCLWLQLQGGQATAGLLPLATQPPTRLRKPQRYMAINKATIWDGHISGDRGRMEIGACFILKAPSHTTPKLAANDVTTSDLFLGC